MSETKIKNEQEEEDDPGNDPNPLGGLVTTIVGDSKTNHDFNPYALHVIVTLGGFADTNLSQIHAITHDDTLNITYILDNRSFILSVDHNKRGVSQFTSGTMTDSMVLLSELHRTCERYMIVSNNVCVYIVSSLGKCTPIYQVIRDTNERNKLSNSIDYDKVNQVNVHSNSTNKSLMIKIMSGTIVLTNQNTGDIETTLAGNVLNNNDTIDGRGLDARFTLLSSMTLCSSQVNSIKIKGKTLSTLNKLDVLGTWPPGITNIIAHLTSHVSSYLLVADGCCIRRVTLPFEFR